MKRFLLLLLIAVITFVIFALIKNPGVLEEIWLWIIGLIGLIIKSFRSIFEYFKNLIADDETSVKEATTKDAKSKATSPSMPEPASATASLPAADVRISLLRYSDDGQTTVGLLYINDKFYCYTLEDTFQEVKVPGETRIPAGSYTLDFRKEETELTTTYRNRYPEWFTYHLHLKNVPNFSAIYIHSGGDHTHTEGCILVSDSLSTKDKQSFLTNSRNTFKALYGFLSNELRQGKKIQIEVKDEGWINRIAS